MESKAMVGTPSSVRRLKVVFIPVGKSCLKQFINVHDSETHEKMSASSCYGHITSPVTYSNDRPAALIRQMSI
jgi:hypothetical protein